MGMRQANADSRLQGYCVNCGGAPETKDHIPSKVFLDKPYPNNLPVVECCRKCNQGFSLDEQYLACFLECVVAGSTDPNSLERESIAETLKQTPSLRKAIAKTCTETDYGLSWEPAQDRVRSVAMKLARGHVAYELSSPHLDEPEDFFVSPVACMNGNECVAFEDEGSLLALWPEVGSRAFERACGARRDFIQNGPWLIVQPGRYHYSVDQQFGTRVRIIIRDYLACYVIWE